MLTTTQLQECLAIPLAAEQKRPVEGTIFQRDAKPVREFNARRCGVLMHPNALVVVDIDVRPQKGVDGFATVAKYGFDLPKTLQVKTPSGGAHLYYSYAGTPLADREIRGSNLKLRDPETDEWLPGVDVKLGNGFVVCPVTGNGYAVTENAPIASPPDWLVDILLGRVGSGSELAAQSNRGGRSEFFPEEAEFMRLLPGADQGERNDKLLYAACRLLERGLTEATAVELILSQYNPRCNPPEAAGIIRNVVSNAAQYCRINPVLFTGLEKEYDALPDEVKYLNIFGDTSEKAESAAGSLPYKTPDVNLCFSIADLLSQTPVKREWLVKSWLPASEISVIYGDGGSGKSLIAAQLAYALAAGSAWLGLPVERSRPVVYVACEDAASELNRRFSKICNGVDKETLPLFVWPWRGQDTYLCSVDRTGKITPTRAYKQLLDHIAGLHKRYIKAHGAEYGGVTIILDTLANLFAGDELSRAQVQSFINKIIAGLCVAGAESSEGGAEYTHSVVMLAHTNKQGQYSGSTAWNNAVAARLALGKKVIQLKNQEAVVETYNDSPVMRLVQEKSNYGPSGQEQSIYFDSGIFCVTDSEARDRELTDRIKEYLGKQYSAKNPVPWPLKRTTILPDGITAPDAMAVITGLINTGVAMVESVGGKNKTAVLKVVDI